MNFRHLVMVAALSVAGCGQLYQRPGVELTDRDSAMRAVGPVPLNAEITIKETIGPRLKDPMSARYRFVDGIRPGWKSIPWPNKSIKFGWIKCAYVNAKNSYGAYTGDQLYYFIINNDSIIYTQYEYVDLSMCKE